jgi:hypothetical protein
MRKDERNIRWGKTREEQLNEEKKKSRLGKTKISADEDRHNIEQTKSEPTKEDEITKDEERKK